MKTIYIPSSAWLGERSRCENLISKFLLAEMGQTDSLILDLAAIRREEAEASLGLDVPFVEIDFRDWVGETLTEEGVINIQAIRRTVAARFENVFVVNAIGFNSNIICRALAQLRIAFFALANWPRGLVLIGDDAQLHQVSPVLAHTFYIRPSFSTSVATKRIVRQVVNEAFIIRIFGRQVGTTLKIFHFLSSWIASSQDRRERKINGWFFEE